MELYTNWIQKIASEYVKINKQITSLDVKSVKFDEHARVECFRFQLNGTMDFEAWGFQTESYRKSLSYCKVNGGDGGRWERVVRFGTCFTQGRGWMAEYHSLVLVMEKICNVVNIDDSDTGDLFEMLLKICWLGQFEGIPDDLKEGFVKKELNYSNEIEFSAWNYKLTKEERELYWSRDKKIVPGSISPFVEKYESWKNKQTRYHDNALKRDVK